MTKIKETLAILKARWPEATLIIGLWILSLFINKLHLLIPLTVESLLRALISFTCFILLIIIIVLIILLTIGFQRTYYLEGKKQQSPLTLFRIGRHFLLRMVGFSLIYIPVFLIFEWITFLTIKQFTSIETGFLETAKVSPIVHQLCFTTATLILMKPLLLTFPLIVVLDCRLFDSFKLLKKCKLLHARELVILFLVSSAVTFLRAFMPKIWVQQYFLITVWTIIHSFIGLMIAVMAVGFVASIDLVYDNEPVTLDSENLHK